MRQTPCCYILCPVHGQKNISKKTATLSYLTCMYVVCQPQCKSSKNSTFFLGSPLSQSLFISLFKHYFISAYIYLQSIYRFVILLMTGRCSDSSPLMIVCVLCSFLKKILSSLCRLVKDYFTIANKQNNNNYNILFSDLK